MKNSKETNNSQSSGESDIKNEVKHEIKHEHASHSGGSRSLLAMRENPWMPATIVLAVVLLALIFFGGFGGVTGGSVSSKVAGENLISFINAQGNGEASVVSSEKQDGMYQVTVKYNGQDIPVYVTLDGKYLISDRVPLTDSGTNTNTNTNTNEPVDVQIGDSPKEGNESASVTIIEFTDYQCPYCGKYYTDTYLQLKKDYIDTGKVFYVLRNFPLSFHDEAQKAAEAALCVRDQKGDAGYWKMHDKLFANQEDLSTENYKKWAVESGAVAATFEKCLTDGKFAQQVKDDFAYGQTIGVQGTPAFFINGKLLSGAQPYSAFKSAIDAALAG